MNEQEVLLALSIIICAYLITIFIGAILIDRLLMIVKRSHTKNTTKNLNTTKDQGSGANGDLEGAGRLIGMLERGIIFTLGLVGEYGAISFVLAAKSMARFKQLERRQFAEIYLIGTLSSFFLALICSIITKNLIIYLFPSNT
ncbi:MAG: hypothetical protein ACW97X_00480 [Candidatus Hodarchaeales archaeon]|jgi:hypothetical protein